MALNLTSRLQVTAHYFWNRRNSAALSHHGVRLDYDPEQRRMSALILGYTLTFLAIGLAALMAYIKPAGQVGKSQILADRDTGAIYVMVDGRLHPALNLTSARLITGEATNPTFVKAAELEKYPQGPTVGIVGAPTQMPVRTGADSAWAVCDTAPAATATTSAGQAPVVTAIAGALTLGRRSVPLAMPGAVLARHNDKTFVVWDGHRSEIDLANKSVALALGVDSAAPKPVPMSTALFDAIPATDPLIIPAIANAGGPSPWDLGPGAVIGSVLSVHDVTQGVADQLFVLLPTGCNTFHRLLPRCCARRTRSAMSRRWRCHRIGWPPSRWWTRCRCPTTRLPGCIWSTPPSTARRAWHGRRAPPTRPPASRCCPVRGCPSPPTAMIGWCIWSRRPTIPPRSKPIRSIWVTRRPIWS